MRELYHKVVQLNLMLEYYSDNDKLEEFSTDPEFLELADAIRDCLDRVEALNEHYDNDNEDL